MAQRLADDFPNSTDGLALLDGMSLAERPLPQQRQRRLFTDGVFTDVAKEAGVIASTAVTARTEKGNR